MNIRFDLISKPARISFNEYKGRAIRLSSVVPETVDEVVLGVRGNHKLKRKVTTFRDSKGNIIERAFDYYDKSYKNVLYSTTENQINNESITSTTKTDYILNRELVTYYKYLTKLPNTKCTVLWSKVKTETNHVSKNKETGEIIHSQVQQKAIKRNKQVHSFYEFPHIVNKKVQNSEPKFLTFTVRSKNNSVISDSIKSNGVKYNEQDPFLGYRALTIEDSKEAFTNYYLRKRELDDKDVKINCMYDPKQENDDNFTAIFNAEDGVINFNKDFKFKSKTQVIKTSAHETEHVRHYFLQALLNGGDTPWQTSMAEQFKELTDPKVIEEAIAIDNSIKNYVPFWKDLEAYKNNFIEKLANKEGESAKITYDNMGEELRESFPHIPKEML